MDNMVRCRNVKADATSLCRKDQNRKPLLLIEGIHDLLSLQAYQFSIDGRLNGNPECLFQKTLQDSLHFSARHKDQYFFFSGFDIHQGLKCCFQPR